RLFHPCFWLPSPLPLFPYTTLFRSLFLTRPSLGHYIATGEELVARSGAVFGMIAAGKLKLRIEHVYPLAEAQRAHRDLEGRKTRSEEHTSELQSREKLVCRLLLEKK